MLTKEDYQNLLNLLARSQFNGIGEAAAAVQLTSKLQALLQAEGKQAGTLGDSTDNS